MNNTPENSEMVKDTNQRALRKCQHCEHKQLTKTPKAEPFCCGNCKRYSK